MKIITFILLCKSYGIKTHTVKLNLLCAYLLEMVLQHSFLFYSLLRVHKLSNML